MSVILKSDHLREVRRIRRRARAIHAAGILIILSLLILPWAYKMEADLITEAYGIARHEFETTRARHELISLMRTKPLSVGQSLDIADIIITQREVPVSLVLAIISQESEFRPEAVSEKNARGLMQITPLVYKTYSDPKSETHKRQMHDPVTNVRTGISYLWEMKEKYGTWTRALRVYQAGPKNADNKQFDWYVRGVLAKMERYESKMAVR